MNYVEDESLIMSYITQRVKHKFLTLIYLKPMSDSAIEYK